MSANKPYALILGASSGFGKATARKLAENGYNIYGVHMDLGQNRVKAEEFRDELLALGVDVHFFNTNAADDRNRAAVVEAIKANAEIVEGHELKLLVHSLAFGTLKYLVSEFEEAQLSKKQLEMTMDVMANSLVYWTQDVFAAKLFSYNSRILAFTSVGSKKAMLNYGAVSAAKAAIEAYIRQLAIELAPHGISSNSIFAGVSSTPAASKIPGFPSMIDLAKEQNPFERVTKEADVASLVLALCNPELLFLNGDIIRIDGGHSVFEYFKWDEKAEGRPKPQHGKL